MGFGVACSVGFASCKTFGKQPKHPCFGVAPMRVVSRQCRCVVQRLCATDFKRPCLVRAAAPHSAPARMPGVYAQGLCRTQSQSSIHSLSPWGRGFSARMPKQGHTKLCTRQSHQGVLKGIGIENLLYFFMKTGFSTNSRNNHLILINKSSLYPE